MRVDWYAKLMLTVIALLLAVVALRPFFTPLSVSAEASVPSFQYTGGAGGFWAIETRTGRVWLFEDQGNGHFKIRPYAAIPLPGNQASR
jgi:hypothetical protein